MKKDRIFTIEGLKKEFKRIKWPHWFKKEVSTEKTVVPTTLKVISIAGVFAAFFVLCDAVSALFLKVIGG